MSSNPRVLSIILVGLLAGGWQAASGAAAQEWPLTRAERTDYAETTRYDEVVAFLEAIAPRSELIHLTTFGYTNEGRALPLVVVGKVSDPGPDAVIASGKLRVYAQGNIHAGEVCGKEALLMLLRAIAAGERDWSDDLVLLIAPIYNADGNERVSITNRPGQNGPLAGMGQRPNAQGLDLNRDHMKAESPEARSLLAMMNRYDPQVSLDLHTTNGTRHGYHLTYSPPLNPNTHGAIDGLLRNHWLPALTETIRAADDEEFYYYGNLPFRGDVERGWYTFDHRPRFNNNYIGLRNRIAILSEAYAYATFAERVHSTYRFVEEILNLAAGDADVVRATIAQADAAPVVGQALAVRSDFARSTEPAEILLGDVEVRPHPYSGQRVAHRREVRTPESMHEFGSFEAIETEVAPTAYLIPAELTAVIDRLQAHGIAMATLEGGSEMTVQRFTIADSTVAPREFQGHRERTLEGAYETTTATIPAGTVRLDLDQPLGRLAFYLLEPRSDDGLVNWNLLDDALEGSAHYPILRIPAIY